MYCRFFFFFFLNKASHFTLRCFLSTKLNMYSNLFCKVYILQMWSCSAKLTANVSNRQACTGINNSLYLAVVQNVF